ncbi:MAG: hypothetical protein HZR80_15330 [Candidatus Heimdallarchaeota archaeon]
MSDKSTRSVKKNVYLQRLKDPIIIIGLILFINFLIMLIVNLINPIILKSILLQDQIIYVSWNGNFLLQDLETHTTEIGIEEGFPFAAGWLLIFSLASSMAIGIIQVLIPIIKADLTRIGFLSKLIWPYFITLGFTLTNSIILMIWGLNERSDESAVRINTNLVYNIAISILLILSIIVVLAYISRLIKKNISL